MTIKDQISEYAEKIFSADDKLLFQNLIEIENGVRLYYDFEYFWDDEKNDLVCKQEPTDYFIEIFNNGIFKLDIQSDWHNFSITFNTNTINEIIKILKEDK